MQQPLEFLRGFPFNEHPGVQSVTGAFCHSYATEYEPGSLRMSTGLPSLSQKIKNQSSLPLHANGKRTFLSEITLLFSEIYPEVSGDLIIA